jgi:hypothetical protein
VVSVSTFNRQHLFKEKTVEPFLGEIKICAFPFAPKGWAFCNGALMSVQQNNALFALLGVQYGGDGKNTLLCRIYAGASPCTEMAIPLYKVKPVVRKRLPCRPRIYRRTIIMWWWPVRLQLPACR